MTEGAGGTSLCLAVPRIGLVENQIFDLRTLKSECRRLLPAGHPVRTVVEGEPDELSGPEGVAKLSLFLRLVVANRRPGA